MADRRGRRARRIHGGARYEYRQRGAAVYGRQSNGLAGRIATSGLSAPDAQKQAYARSYQLVQAQSASLAYVDTFMVLAVGSAIMFLLAFALKKNAPGSGGNVAVE